MKLPPIDDVTAERIRRKLEPESVHANLVSAAFFITTFELLKGEVLRAPYALLLPKTDADGEFFTALMEGRIFYTQRYKAEVWILAKEDRFRAACLWLHQREAISEQELEELVGLRQYRNEVVHELPKCVIDIAHDVSATKFTRCAELVARIGRWVAIMDGVPETVNPEDSTPGSLLIVRLMAESIAKPRPRLAAEVAINLAQAESHKRK